MQTPAKAPALPMRTNFAPNWAVFRSGYFEGQGTCVSKLILGIVGLLAVGVCKYTLGLASTYEQSIARVKGSIDHTMKIFQLLMSGDGTQTLNPKSTC